MLKMSYFCHKAFKTMKKTHLIGGILILISVIALMSMVQEMSPYVSFSDAAKQPDRKFQVVGQLSKDKEMVYNPEENPNYFSFYMRDQNEEERKVVLLDAKPQDFERTEEIVLTGSMKDGEFIASSMLVKCPSKYVEEEVRLKEISYQ